MLLLAVAPPAARRDTARRESALENADGAAARKADVDRSAHGEVAAGRDEAVAGKEPGRLVDGERLDDAVQVERETGRAAEDQAVEPHLARDATAQRGPAGSARSPSSGKSRS